MSTVVAQASEHHGQVTFNGLPVPGATVIVTHDGKKFETSTNEAGRYSFADVPDGASKIEIKMLGFAPVEQDLTVVPNAPGVKWEMKMLPLNDVIAQTKVVKATTPAPVVAEAKPTEGAGKKEAAKPAESAPAAPKPSEESEQANDGFLVNGSVNNAATSQFSLARAFGNTRQGSKSLYNGGLGLIFGNAAMDAKPYSLNGLSSPKADYNRITAIATFGGPLKIPHLLHHGPNFFLVYQWTRDRNSQSAFGLVPTQAQHAAAVGADPVAQALLALYPLPNTTGVANYNYQVPVLSSSHEDAFQGRANKSVGRRDEFYGAVALQSTRGNTTNLFGFRDTTETFGINTNINWQRRLAHNLWGTFTYRFSRLSSDVSPYFKNRVNVSGNAGMTGNNQDPANWGPPTLNFSSGIYPLSDGQSAFNRNETNGVNVSVQWYRGHHNYTFGAEFRRQEFNYFQQQDPRGTFTFTTDTTGTDFQHFLQGVPSAASINYGNPDKYLRQSVYTLYANDDWRLRPDLTINAGVRWDYGAPITELKNRMANLDVASGFTAVAPVVAGSPTGSLTGQQYPNSLLRPDRSKIQPRVGISWRPIAGSSMVVRAGYGLYVDTSVYQSMAIQMAQQSPFAHSISADNATCAQSLATGPNPCTSITQNTYAVDPNFRTGFAQTWQVAVQRDLPAALQMTATYLGVKGTNGVQQFLPNTYAPGAANPCPSCPVGFVYRTSGGTSWREAGSLKLRRRLRSGFTATLQYTYSKSMDNDAVLGGQGPMTGGATSQTVPSATIAQNWLNLDGERGLSTFDQRHVLTSTFQYTTGMGMGGGTLMRGWRGRIYKEWTVLGEIDAGTGKPLTPVYLTTLAGTGYTGTVRPNRTGQDVYAAPAGRYLNPAAFTDPQAGQWGNAGRNSIKGPGSFTFNASMSRTFRLDARFNLDVRADVTNLLNHAVFTGYNTTVNPGVISPVFGLPSGVNDMRKVQITARVRF